MIGRPAAICRRGSGIVSTVIALSLLAGGARGAAISELKATHRDGQTFLTWQEADTPGADDSLSIADSMKLAAEWKPRLAFRVYRADKPIASVAGLEPIGTTGPLSCWNAAFPVEHKFGPQDMMARFVIEEGKPPLAAGTGLYVHNPAAVGKAYYAVVAVLDGKEVGTASTAVAVDEKPGIGVPVLQSTRKLEGKEEFNFVAGPTLHTFIRWEAPPHANRENMASEILVAVPKNLPQPASLGLHLHCWGGSPKGGYGWWFNAEKGAILVAPNQYPYDWWTGYHERYGLGPRDERSWKDGVVHPYTQRRVLSLLDWAATRWQVDPSQTFVAGNSMGGSGAPMLALRHPQRFAWAVGWVGIHVPELSDHFKASYANVYGDPAWNVKFEDGTPVWEHFNDAAYLRKHVEQDTPFLTWSNGRNDAAIGWKQAVEFAAAMQETKRPHIFMWGNNGHNQRALMPLSLEQRVNPLDLRVDQSQPAFTRCSLDGKPGNGDPGDGDAEGNFNLYLFWDTKDVVDDADAWEMTVGLAPKAPEAECRVDLTPRRLQRFKPRAGETLQWTNTSGGKEVQAGTVKVDAHGLATIEGLTVGKDRNRVRVTRGR